MNDHAAISFPQEIWWLVAQELGRRRDFGGLFSCALLGRGIARLALPELYAIHHMSPAINAHILGIEATICLWRSIIASSLGTTLFPYCCWIKALKLGSLQSQLEDLARGNPRLKAQLFSPPLERLQIRRGRGSALDLEAVIIEVANMVTECIRSSADQQHTRMGITALEGYYLPTANLPGWVSSLYSLTSLAVRDGSVLNADVGLAIRESCPAFRDVQCFFCTGTDVDEDLAGFFRNLKPNSLESFTVMSMNEIGAETFKALCKHSDSLRFLRILSLERSAFQSLNELQHCLSLESLKLEGAFSARSYPWATECQQVYEEVVQWLQNSASLQELNFVGVPASTSILTEVLKSPTIRITSLNLITAAIDGEFYMSLREQQQLRHLVVKIVDDDILEAGEERHMVLAKAISFCEELRELDINELLSFEAVDFICGSLHSLETLALDGDLIDDVFLAPISRLPKLKSLNVLGASIISPDAVLEFLDKVAGQPEGEHEGLQVYISNQNADFKFTDEEEVRVTTSLSNRFRGRFDISYQLDRDELHESDFSD